MSFPYIGEIRLLPYLRGAPSGWQVCDGSLLSIANYQVLYTVLGTTYGGDGASNFGVPDLRSRVPVHQGTGGGLSARPLGQSAGQESVTLNTQQMGQHNHVVLASTNAATVASPAGAVLAAVPSSLNDTFYDTNPTPGDAAGFPATAIVQAGGNQPHDNTAPTQTLQYCIAWSGIFPAQN